MLEKIDLAFQTFRHVQVISQHISLTTEVKFEWVTGHKNVELWVGMTWSTASNNLVLIVMDDVKAGTCRVGFNMGLLNIGARSWIRWSCLQDQLRGCSTHAFQVKSEVTNLEGAALTPEVFQSRPHCVMWKRTTNYLFCEKRKGNFFSLDPLVSQELPVLSVLKAAEKEACRE